LIIHERVKNIEQRNEGQRKDTIDILTVVCFLE